MERVVYISQHFSSRVTIGAVREEGEEREGGREGEGK